MNCIIFLWFQEFHDNSLVTCGAKKEIPFVIQNVNQNCVATKGNQNKYVFFTRMKYLRDDDTRICFSQQIPRVHCGCFHSAEFE